MILLILSFLVSIIPSVLIILWLRKRKEGDSFYEKSCNSALRIGVISVLPILAVSGLLFIFNAILRATILRDVNTLVYKAIYSFVVLAFAEEIVKYLGLRSLLKKKYSEYSWADIVAFMIIIGAMFGLVEDIPYAIGASPMIMLVRGFTMGHIGYGFIMGWFYGKRIYTGKKWFGILAIFIPFLLHGIYDYSLTPELIELNDNLAVIGVSMALIEIVLIVLMICFFIRARKKEQYNKALITIDTNT